MSSLKIIYSECSLPFWKDVALRLQKELDWQPCYWTAHPNYRQQDPDFRSEIEASFPGIIFHDNYDAVNGIPAEGLKDLPLEPIDEEVLKGISFNVFEALKMMDRMDPLFVFDYQERKRQVYYYIRYWQSVINHVKPDVFFAPDAPHLVYDYIMYALCRRNGIRTVMFSRTRIPGCSLYIRDTHDEVPEYLTKVYNELKESEQIELSDESEQYLEKIAGNYSVAVPDYMKAQLDRQKEPRKGATHLLSRILYFNRYAQYVDHVRTSMFPPSPRTYFKSKGSENGENMSGRAFNALKKELKENTKQLKAYYESKTNKIDLNLPFIYVPLVFEAERTNCPDGGAFTDQFLIVDLVAKYVPEGWKVYVKEHPSQFLGGGSPARHRNLYDDLINLPNVSLVPTTDSPFDLIDKSKAVANLTGTAGWEAILRNKPVLLFGFAWYYACEGAFPISTKEDCIKALEKIEIGHEVNRHKVLAFVKAMEKCCISAYLGRKSPADKAEESVKNISDILIKWNNNELNLLG